MESEERKKRGENLGDKKGTQEEIMREKNLKEGSVKESETHSHSSVKQPGQSTSNFLWSDWSIAVVITGKRSEPCNTPVGRRVCLCGRKTERVYLFSVFTYLCVHTLTCLTVCVCVYFIVCIQFFLYLCLQTIPVVVQ